MFKWLINPSNHENPFLLEAVHWPRSQAPGMCAILFSVKVVPTLILHQKAERSCGIPFSAAEARSRESPIF